jgi:tetratricopeptide (TPR) repeat protein
VAALLPVLGFFDVYYFRYSFVADHFQYLASVGLIALTASVGATICKQAGRQGARFGAVTAAIMLMLLAALTWRQGHNYRDAETLWRDTLSKDPQSWLAHNNLGNALLQAGKAPEAIGRLEQALRIKADFPEAHNNLGNALVQLGKVQDAIGHYEQALRIRPDFANAHNNLGGALLLAGKAEEAIGQYEQALRLAPDLADAHNNLGNALLLAGKAEEAIRQYEQALRLAPDFADAHFNLGVALEKLGDTQEAIQHYEQALRIRPDFAQAQNALARLQAVQ